MVGKKFFLSITEIILVLVLLVGSFSCCRKEAEVEEKVESEETKTVDECFEKQGPLKFDEKTPQQYRLTSTMYNRDMDGNIVSSMQITGSFVRSVEEEEVVCRWNNVRMVSSRETEAEFPDGKPLDYMEGLSYALSDEILTEDFYANFPEEDRAYVKALIWDTPWIDVAYVGMGNIEYNRTFFSSELEHKEVSVQNFALLKTKNLKLKWTGIAKKNGETCALLEFKAPSNPVTTQSDILSIRGRSCCWGSFWVSLDDNEVEYAEVNEDVIMDMSISGKPLGEVLNMQREVIFEKR
jgi:hypothetical protein